MLLSQTIMVHADPPPAVQDAVAAVIAACKAWPPVAMSSPPPLPPLVASSPVPSSLSEAQVCDYLAHPEAPVWLGVNMTLILVLVAFGFVWFTRLHRLPGVLWRLAQQGWIAASRRRQGGNPWR